jgi:hypothetical protein
MTPVSIVQWRLANIGEGTALNQIRQTVNGLQNELTVRRGIRHGVGAAGLLEFGDAGKGDVVWQFAGLLLVNRDSGLLFLICRTLISK